MSITHYNSKYYEELHEIIPLNKWISYDDYLNVWNGKNGIWKFIEKKRSAGRPVYINNFAYNYMDTKQFYFSWEQKTEMIDGKPITYAMFDYLDIRHEYTRRNKNFEEDCYSHIVNGPKVDSIIPATKTK